MKENLLMVISTDNVESIQKFPLLYGSVALPREYWKKVHIMFWGASIKTLSEHKVLQQLVLDVAKTGVSFSSCIVCSDDYGVTSQLEALGVHCDHTGELLTEALQSERWSVLTV